MTTQSFELATCYPSSRHSQLIYFDSENNESLLLRKNSKSRVPVASTSPFLLNAKVYTDATCLLNLATSDLD